MGKGESLLEAARSGNLNEVAALLEKRRFLGFSLPAKSIIDYAGPDGTTPLQAAVSGKHKDIVKLLIERGAEVNAKDNSGRTPLHMAVSEDLADMVELLIGHGALADAKDSSGQTPADLALSSGNAECLELLLGKQGDLNVRDKEGDTLLCRAVSRGDCRISEMLIAHGADVNAPGAHQLTPLHLAARHSHEDIARLLVSNGAKVNALNKWGDTPLDLGTGHTGIASLLIQNGADLDADNKENSPMYHALSRGNLEVVQVLIDKGVSIKDIGPELLTTLLCIACSNGNTDIASLLITNGADVNGESYTPLWRAILDDRREIVELLVSNGADTNHTPEEGRSPLNLALNRAQEDIAVLLIEGGADVNHRNPDGYYPLHWTCHRGLERAAELLIEKGADLNAVNDHCRTPLLEVVRHGDAGIVRLLVANGADVNMAPNPNSWTPLHEAASYGQYVAAKLLIQHGAEARAKDIKGRTPRDVALEYGHRETADLLASKSEREGLSIEEKKRKSINLERSYWESGLGDLTDDPGDERMFGDYEQLVDASRLIDSDPQKAIEVLTPMRDSLPDFDLPYLWIAIAYMELSKPTEAEASVRTGLKRSLRKSLLLEQMGQWAMRIDDISNAVYWFIRSAEAQRANPISHTSYLYLQEAALACNLEEIAAQSSTILNRINAGLDLRPETKKKTRQLAVLEKGDIESQLRRASIRLDKE